MATSPNKRQREAAKRAREMKKRRRQDEKQRRKEERGGGDGGGVVDLADLLGEDITEEEGTERKGGESAD